MGRGRKLQAALVGGAALCAALAAAASPRGTIAGPPEEPTVFCEPEAGKVRVVAPPESGDYVLVGYRAADDALRVLHIGGPESGPYFKAVVICTDPDRPWRRIVAELGDDSDTLELDGGSGPGFLRVPAGIEVKAQGSKGFDELNGHQGVDRLRAGSGRDALRGRGDDDVLIGGRGKDRLSGNQGDDRIEATHGGRDIVFCGRGDDLALIDEHDSAKGCERVAVAVPANGER